LLVIPARPAEVLVALIWSSAAFWGCARIGVAVVDQAAISSGHRRAGIIGQSYGTLLRGRITHGCQFAIPSTRWATSYYGDASGLGQAVEFLQQSGPIRVGAIGLGVGTVAAYARSGDVFRFYEINPEVIRMAREHFTYLADCPGRASRVRRRPAVVGSGTLQRFDFGAGRLQRRRHPPSSHAARRWTLPAIWPQAARSPSRTTIN
jgi:hypothetical protein